MQTEVTASALLADVGGVHVGFVAESVSGHRFRDLRKQLADNRILQTENRLTVKRQPLDEIDEGLPEALEVAAVGFQMIGIDVRDHRHHRLQIQERGVALVGLGNQIAARTQAGVDTAADEPPADDIGGIEPALGEQARDQTRRGGLAMGAGDGDAVAETHQLGEHLRPRHHRDVPIPGAHELRVVRIDGRRNDDHLAVLDVLGIVTDVDAHTEVLQTPGHGVGGEIRARHLKTERVQHLGDAAHAGAADADEVHAANAFHPDVVVHVRTPAGVIGARSKGSADGAQTLRHGRAPSSTRTPAGWRRGVPGAARPRPSRAADAARRGTRRAARRGAPHRSRSGR